MIFQYYNRYLFTVFTFIVFIINTPVKSQTINTTFGKNRVQYSSDFNNWWLYETDNYLIFWYTKELNLAKSVILLSQISYNDIEDLVDYKINKKIKIIVYSDLSDFKQTNIGVKDKSWGKERGTSKIKDNKIIIYFDGDFDQLLYQIREGTANIFLQNMFENHLSLENAYNSILNKKPPSWFTLGAAAFLADDWDEISDNQLRNIFAISQNQEISFEKLQSNFPKLAGKSFFHYIKSKFKKVSDIFYLFRITKNINSSFRNTTGKSLKELFEEWKIFYLSIYSKDNNFSRIENEHPVNKVSFNNKNIIYSSIRIDNTNKYLAYVTDNYGKKSIFLVNLKNKKQKKIFSNGYINRDQISDLNYPAINFFHDSNYLAIIFKEKDASILKIINVKTLETLYSKSLPFKLKSITSFDIWDKNSIILTAMVNGNIDIFKYNLRKRNIKQLTDDFWVDKDIRVVTFGKDKGILFSSNRTGTNLDRQTIDTILPNTNFDIFFYDLPHNKLVNLTKTKNINEKQAFKNNMDIFYISDETGIPNIKVTHLNKNSSLFLTNNNYNVQTLFKNKPLLAFSDKRICLNSLILSNPSPIGYSPNLTTFKKNKTNTNIIKKENIYNDIEIDYGILFQSKYKDYKGDLYYIVDNNANTLSTKNKLKRYIPSHAIASRLRFSFSKFTTKLDNEPLFDGMSVFTENNQNYVAPKIGVLSKVLIQDMFEDYFIETGLRISPDFNEKEYFTVFDNLKHLVDWQYVYYRKNRTNFQHLRQTVIDKFSNTTNLFRVKAKYPFDVYRSISLASNLRIDKNNIYGSDTISINQPSLTEQRISLRLEYIFDNTGILGTNLLEGNRSKAFIEIYNKFNIIISNPSTLELSKGLMTVLGFDIRQYFKILNRSIIALRAVGQTSFGTEKNIYFLGGMENWQFSRYENFNQNSKSEKIAYKILAANLRGFGYNAKSGSSFALFNSELRIPVFRYFLNINKAFFRDFQLTCFFDTGLSWNGISPFSTDNSTNIKYIEVPPTIKLKLRYYADPMIAGYGFGVRSTILGYFLKLDYAWGIETRKLKTPILYFSVGLDF